jgi:hypothetical protein
VGFGHWWHMERLTFDLTDFLWSLLNAVLNYGGGTFAVGVVGLVVDRIIKFVPWLSPMREVVKQWTLKELERLQLERAKPIILETGQMFRNGVIPQNDRASVAAINLKHRRVTGTDDRAASLVEQAVSQLKREGVNP